MPTDERSAWDRSSDLDEIRATYARYDESGRHRLWDETNAGYARLARELRARLLGEIRRSLPRDGGRLLDLGCGSGDLVEDVARSGLHPDWTGVDLRPEAIESARGRYADARFLVASADDVPEEDASFDVVVAQVLFSSLPSERLERAVVGEIARLLRPGGWVVWSDLRYANPSNPGVHALDSRRLRRLFAGWAIDVRPAGLLPPMARRLGATTPVLFPLFAAIPPLRGHLVGRLQPPAGRR